MTTGWTPISETDAKKHKLYGVRGWLLVFAIGLFLNLLRELGSLSGEARQAGMTLGQLLSISHPAVTFIKVYWLALISLVVLVYWMMATKATAFRRLTSWILLGFTPVTVLIGVSNSFYGPDNAVQALIGWAVSCAVWVTYLNRSRRVRVTFEHLMRENAQTLQATSPITSAAPNPSHTSATTSPTPPALPRSLVGVMESDSEPIAAEGLDEAHWAQAMEEFEGTHRRVGLWARCFTQAKGDETLAKVAYLEARVREIAQEQQATLEEQERSRLRKAADERLSRLPEDQRAYELIPKGACPNCSFVQPLDSTECPACKALFGPQADWKLIPVSQSGNDVR